MDIETQGLLETTIVLMLLVTFPIKVGAVMTSARRSGIGWCALAAIVGVAAATLALQLLGDYLGGLLAAFLGFVVAIRIILGTSLFGAVGLTIIALAVQILAATVLSQYF